MLLYLFFLAILKIPTRVFLMPVRGAGYTFNPLSINRVGFFLSINREKIRLFCEKLNFLSCAVCGSDICKVNGMGILKTNR